MEVQPTYTPKELSAVLFTEHDITLSEQTIQKRCRLWERNPKHVLAIPYLRQLGRPMRIPAAVLQWLVTPMAPVPEMAERAPGQREAPSLSEPGAQREGSPLPGERGKGRSSRRRKATKRARR